MAINLLTQYPGKADAASAAYPFGKARNVTVPGDGTGTPWEQAIVNDMVGWQQALLSAVGATPTGTPDQVGASQYLDAIEKVARLAAIPDPSQTYTFPTVAAFKDSPIEFIDGKIIHISDITSGDLVSAIAEIVLTSSVTPNDRNIFQSTDVPTQSIVLSVQDSTYTEFTWFVDDVLGSDVFGQGVTAGAGAFKTPQFAIDQLPSIISHQQTIQLADGTYNTSSRPNTQDARPSVIQFSGKTTTLRSALSGDDISGPLVIKGNAADNSAVKIQSSLNYPHGVYNNTGNIALQDLTVNTTTNAGGILIVSHRNTSHVFTKNVVVDSIFATRTTAGISTESGGQLEFVDGKIKNCAIGAFAQGAGENMTFATREETIFENNDIAVIAKNNNFVQLVSLQLIGKIEIIDSSNTDGILVIAGSHVTIVGANTTTDMCQINASIELDQASMNLVFAETLGVVTVTDSSIKYNASNYQRNIIVDASTIQLVTSNSFVSPATANTDTRPIQLLNGSLITESGTNNINGSGGLDRPSVFPSILTFSANNQVLSPVAKRLTSVIVSSSVAAPRVGCEIDSSVAYEGQEMRVTFNDANSNNVQLIGTGTHMRFANPILIGKGVGDYTGANFILSDGKWEIFGLGQLIV